MTDNLRPPNPALNVYAAPQTLAKIGRRRRVNLRITGEGGPPAVLELVGMGPVKTIPVGEDGKPLPPKPGQ